MSASSAAAATREEEEEEDDDMGYLSDSGSEVEDEPDTDDDADDDDDGDIGNWPTGENELDKREWDWENTSPVQSLAIHTKFIGEMIRAVCRVPLSSVAPFLRAWCFPLDDIPLRYSYSVQAAIKNFQSDARRFGKLSAGLIFARRLEAGYKDSVATGSNWFDRTIGDWAHDGFAALLNSDSTYAGCFRRYEDTTGLGTCVHRYNYEYRRRADQDDLCRLVGPTLMMGIKRAFAEEDELTAELGFTDATFAHVDTLHYNNTLETRREVHARRLFGALPAEQQAAELERHKTLFHARS